MAKISLRAYNREIETLIDRGNHDQAIAHCRHILSIYNKYIYSYRLLGKAYLESQRFGDAADIFQRVLSTLPDDFISQVGMSIIREDEGTLDEAIWHMERAYEVQPANNAIQRELQRLYGKRDGIEPPKIRLTRGALARMYIKGELYQQAINELRPSQAQVSQRPDLYVLLAQVYYLTGKRVDAAQACNQLIKRFPFCFEANRILTAILTESDRADETKVYRQRLIALDPYAAHTSPTAHTPDEVPDSAVSLEKLEWSPDAAPAGMLSQPEWASSLGVEIGEEPSEEETLPEWLDSMGEPSTTTEDIGEAISEASIPSVDPSPLDLTSDEIPAEPSADDKIPVWLKDAGWEASSSPVEDTPEIIAAEDEQDISPDELAPADLPDWVQAIAPSEEAAEGDISSDEDSSEIGDDSLPVETSALPWLEETPPGPTDTVASWLEEQEPQVPEAAELDLEPGEPIEIPEWLQDLKQDEIPPVPAGYKPDQELEASLDEGILDLVAEDAPEPEKDISAGEIAIGAAAGLVAASIGDVEQPDQEIDEAVLDSEEEIPDWLQASDEIEPSTPVESTTETTDELPELLQEPDAEPPIDQPEPIEIDTDLETTLEIEETVEVSPGLEDLIISSTETEGVVEEDLTLAIPEETIETIEVEQDIEEATFEEDEEAPLPLPMEEQLTTQEEDEAFAWLEGLAAKQGVDEALVLSPEDRKDTPPEWVQSSAEEVDAGIQPETTRIEAESVPTEQTELVSEDEADEVPDWLKGIEPSEPTEAEPVTSESTEIPDWLKEAEIESGEPSEPDVVPVEADLEAEPTDEIPDWLKGSAAITGVAAVASTIDEVTSPEPAETIEPVEMEQGADIPEWLLDTEIEQPVDEVVSEFYQVGFEEKILDSEKPTEGEEQIPAIPDTEAELVVESGEEIPAAPRAETLEELEIQPVLEDEMLFGPKILDGVSEAPEASEYQDELTLEEGRITDADTKPIRISPPDEVPIPSTLADSAPVETTEAGEEVEITEKALEEELPDWIQDLSEEIELPADAVEPIEDAEAPIDEVPEWLSDMASEEISIKADAEVISETSEVSEEPIDTESETEATVTLDDEDAFAWLEGLAAKHGAEEAMLLEPEDRQDTPPEWVQSEGETEGTTIQPVIADELTSEPDVSVEDISAVLDDVAGVETPDIGETVEETLEPPLISLEETAPETPFGEEAKAEEVTSEPDLEMTDVETKLMEGVTEEDVEGEETVPELPTWLAGIEEESSVIETPEWTPAAEVIEEQESQVLPVEEQPSQINLNEAGLVELEHLPGVGFIKAQAIIEYRESIGPFASVEDLQNVSGIGPSLIEELRELIIVDVPVEAAALEGPTDEHQVTMIQARNALIEGDINHSLEHYNKLIQSQQMLPDVIQDLNEALYRFPVDIGIWQTLGDALMRMGRIQEALDAYTKAEELLR